MKFLKKLTQPIFLISTVISTVAVLNTSISHASQVEIPPLESSRIYGTSYWKSSNIREWLNSEEKHVSYTMATPSYGDEAGFLSNFTESERNAIAVTKRRNPQTNGYYQTSEGGSKDIFMGISSESTGFTFEEFTANWKDYYYHKTNDKVFLLSIPEMFYYYESKFDNNKIPYSEEASKRIANPSNRWLFSTGWVNIGNEDYIYSIGEDGKYEQKLAYYKTGIVPALHVKPEYVFSDGRRADSLNIGDIVKFGRYNNFDMEWVVINKTSNGYPLLFSTKIIDDKEFNKPSNTIYKESNYINFTSHDVDISEDLNLSGKNGDASIPTMNVVNESDMFSRRAGSYNIVINASDSSGINYILLPNGNKIYNNSSVSYNVSTNDKYTFIASDNNGNKRRFVVPIGNINSPSQVLAIPSATGWTNQDVSVDIFASNDVGTEVSEHIQRWRDDYLTGVWANYSSYANKTIRISGSVEFVSSNVDNTGIDASIGVHYNNLYKGKTGDYHVGYEWKTVRTYKLSDLQSSGKRNFSIEYTIPGDYYMNLRPWTTITVPHGNQDHAVKWTNIKYELVDSQDFGISKIVLPDGREVFDKKYTDVLTQDGNYLYEIHDKNGNIYHKTIRALIDKDAPELDINYETRFTNKNLNIDVSARDSKSGINNTRLPDGTSTSRPRTTYYAKENGELVFTATDNAGNKTVKTVNIKNIDKINPTLSGTVSYSSDKSSAILNISVNDEGGSGVKSLQNYKGNFISGKSNLEETVLHNGYYTFAVFDEAGNKSIKTLYVDGLNNNFISQLRDVQYKLEGATVKNWTKYTGDFVVINEGVTTATVRATDNAGNTSEASSIVKVDKTSPNMLHSITYNPDNTLATILITGNDPLSGIKSIISNDGTVINSNSYTFTTDKNGEFLVSGIDNAGNISFLSVSVNGLSDNNSSGIKEIQYKLEGATVQDWSKYTSTFRISNEGTTIVKAKSYDMAGNVSDEISLSVKVDKTKPIENRITISLIK